jgi:hypothetical protein
MIRTNQGSNSTRKPLPLEQILKCTFGLRKEYEALRTKFKNQLQLKLLEAKLVKESHFVSPFLQGEDPLEHAKSVFRFSDGPLRPLNKAFGAINCINCGVRIEKSNIFNVHFDIVHFWELRKKKKTLRKKKKSKMLKKGR